MLLLNQFLHFEMQGLKTHKASCLCCNAKDPHVVQWKGNKLREVMAVRLHFGVLCLLLCSECLCHLLELLLRLAPLPVSGCCNKEIRILPLHDNWL